MIVVLAHVMMIPVEEMLVPLASGAGAGMVIWLRWKLANASRIS